MSKVILELDEYQARNLCWALRVISVGWTVPTRNEYMKSIFEMKGCHINTGDWLGEIRWMLEPQVDKSQKANSPDPEWAADYGQWISKKEYEERFGRKS